MHADHRAGFVARLEEGVPVAVLVVNAGQAEHGGELAERDGSDSSLRIAPDFECRQPGVP